MTPAEWTALRPHLSELWQTFYDLLWETGIRPGEGLRVERDHVAEHAGRWTVRVRRLKKRSQERVDEIPIPAWLGRAILARTNFKRRMPFPRTERAADLALKRAARSAGVRPTIHPHLFRHGFGRRWAKMDLGYSATDHVAMLKEMLGHSRMVTTEIYFRPGPDEVEEAWDRLHGKEPAPNGAEERSEVADALRKALGLD